jgi:signal transduction histidine kinase
MDKQRVLQILVNLISNSKYALSDNQKKNKILTIRSYQHGENRLRIEVKDNGIGIPKENMAKIFTHGFTTKKDGHGFGLHSSALAAKAMGGSLTVHSDGPGHGATFTLELPLKLSKAVR